MWHKPIIHESFSGIPIYPHPGSFGVIRKNNNRHTGIDLYADDGTEVYACESGVILTIEPFTGKIDNSPWWNDTYCILIGGVSENICYGEITPLDVLKVGDKLEHGQLIGHIKRVLLEGKERHDIIGHKPNMLHLEVYPNEITIVSEHWHDSLLDPTEKLLETYGEDYKLVIVTG
jgi:hypothetical protein